MRPLLARAARFGGVAILATLMAACGSDKPKPTPLEATISSAPTSDCQPSPAEMRSPATMEGTAAGSSTSVIARQALAPSICAASMYLRSTCLAPR